MENQLKFLSATQYKEVVKSSPVVVIPVGSMEQHGPHMPLAVDELLSVAVSKEVAQKADAVVGPEIHIGYKSQQRSGGGYHLPGTISLKGKTLIDFTKELVVELVHDGFKRFVFCNGHFENYQFLFEGVDEALRDLKVEGIDDVKVVLMSYWDFVDDSTIEKLYPEGFTGWDLEHGGVLETSLMLLLYPELVDMNAVVDAPPADLPNYDILPIKAELTPESGCLSSAAAATREKGEILLRVASDSMAEAIRNEF